VLQPLSQVREDLTRWATSDIARVPTGYSFIDEPTGGGPAPGEMVLFIARSRVGKTWWALNVLAANRHTPAIFFSLEMHNRYLLKRLAGVYTDTPTKDIEKALMHQGWAQEIDDTVQAFPYLQMMDIPGLGIPDMISACDAYAEDMGRRPRLVVIDFMELVQVFGASDTENVKKLAKSLKDMARQIDAVVIVLHQVSRGAAVKRQGSDRAFTNEGHRPLTTGDAMHGGEQAADFMIGMFKPSLDPEMPRWERINRAHELQLQFLKTRGDEEIDPYLAIEHRWDQPTGRITELDWSIYK
jgi:replicative DNA helicase